MHVLAALGWGARHSDVSSLLTYILHCTVACITAHRDPHCICPGCVSRGHSLHHLYAVHCEVSGHSVRHSRWTLIPFLPSCVVSTCPGWSYTLHLSQGQCCHPTPVFHSSALAVTVYRTCHLSVNIRGRKLSQISRFGSHLWKVSVMSLDPTHLWLSALCESLVLETTDVATIFLSINSWKLSSAKVFHHMMVSVQSNTYMH